MTPSQMHMAKRLGGLCPVCETSVYDSDEKLQIHHIIPKLEGGKDTYTNMCLIHTTCHQSLHAQYYNGKEFKNQVDILLI